MGIRFCDARCFHLACIRSPARAKAVSRSERSRPWKTIPSVVADDTSVLGTLARQARELGRCEDSLEGYLHPSGSESLRVAAIEGDAVVVVVDSAARGARLRFLAPRIVAHAADVLGRPDLERLDVRVRPAPAEKPEKPRTARTAPSPATRELLRSAAETIGDPRLKEILLRMCAVRPAEPAGADPAVTPGRPPEHGSFSRLRRRGAAGQGRGADPASG